MPSTSDGRQAGDRVLRALLLAVFLVAGGMKLAASEFEVSNFARFGYPARFIYAVGAAQLLGAGLLWIRGYVAHGALLCSDASLSPRTTEAARRRLAGFVRFDFDHPSLAI